MSTGTIEVTRLEDMPDLTEVPPCEVNKAVLQGGGACGKPSVARVRVNHECGMKRTLFVCAYCLQCISLGWIRCGNCGSYEGKFSWREV